MHQRVAINAFDAVPASSASSSATPNSRADSMGRPDAQAFAAAVLRSASPRSGAPGLTALARSQELVETPLDELGNAFKNWLRSMPQHAGNFSNSLRRGP